MTKGKLIYWNGVFAAVLAIVAAVNIAAASNDNILRVFLGSMGSTQESFEESSYKTAEDLRKAQEKFTTDLMEEGSVLLKNENNALPLQEGSLKVSVFGQNSVNMVRGGTGSSTVSAGEYGNINMKDLLSDAGFSVNTSLWDYYKSHPGRSTETGGDFKCYESTYEELNTAVGSSFSQYSDAAIVIISRIGSEAADLPMTNDVSNGGDGTSSYLALTPKERDMLKGIHDSGLFKKTIVVLNSGNAVQTDFLKDEQYGVDACLLFGMTGVYGLSALPDLLLGKADPSGRLNDTYVYDSLSAPAARNFGDARYTNASIEKPADTRSTIYESDNYGSSEFSFVNYAEGIYVGYKYYETRYEDAVLEKSGVGSYEYQDVVSHPFGYGQSYTTFSWSDFSANENGDEIIAKVKVTNTGKRSGKEVVQLYYQAPYTEGGPEKASVNLAGFAKTKSLSPDESEEVTITMSKDDMKSYDSSAAVSGRAEKGAYVMDEGDYFITAAKDSHAAINNILEQKGKDPSSSKMTAKGDRNFVYRFNLSEKQIIHQDDSTGKEIHNLFEDAYKSDASYLSRSNWSVLDDAKGLKYATGTGNLIAKSKSTGEVVNSISFETRPASDDDIARIKAVGWDNAGRPADEDKTITTSAGNGSKLQDVQGKSFDDGKWDSVLDNLSQDELKKSFLNGAFSTAELTSIGKTPTIDLDGPSGITNFTNGHGGFGFPSCSVLARTFNLELAREYGKLVAEDGLRMGVHGWYAPCVNINRTPFTARSYESYSEDAYLTGIMASEEILGCQSKGMYVYVKHFALNEQGINRNYICTWGQEQAFREIYFKPFEMAVKKAKATGIMASMNRIGYRLARGHYNLLTGLLKTEWGFQGAVVTDAITYGSSAGHTEQALAAGTDLMLNSTRVSLSNDILAKNATQARLRDAAHRVCYMVVNSGAYHSIATGGMPYYVLILILVDSISVLGIGIADFFLFRSYLKKKKEQEKTN